MTLELDRVPSSKEVAGRGHKTTGSIRIISDRPLRPSAFSQSATEEIWGAYDKIARPLRMGRSVNGDKRIWCASDKTRPPTPKLTFSPYGNKRQLVRLRLKTTNHS